MDKTEQKKIDDERRKEIGRRIREERKRTKNPAFSNGRCYSQESFAEQLHISKQAYNNLENGVGEPKLEYLYRIKELCGCDIGYLVGEYECRTKGATDIHNATGLSEKAIDTLIKATKIDRTSLEYPSFSKEIQKNGFAYYKNYRAFMSYFLESAEDVLERIEYERYMNRNYIENTNIIKASKEAVKYQKAYKRAKEELDEENIKRHRPLSPPVNYQLCSKYLSILNLQGSIKEDELSEEEVIAKAYFNYLRFKDDERSRHYIILDSIMDIMKSYVYNPDYYQARKYVLKKNEGENHGKAEE